MVLCETLTFEYVEWNIIYLAVTNKENVTKFTNSIQILGSLNFNSFLIEYFLYVYIIH